MINQLKSLFQKKESKSIHEILKPHEEIFNKKPIEISLPIVCNTQRDNTKFNFIPPSSQCGYTTIAMVFSQFIPEAKTDLFISDIIVTFEKNFVTGKGSRFALTMDNHVKIYQYYIDKYKLNKEIVFIPQDGTLEDIIKGLQCGSPVGFSWMPTTSGHYSAIIGYSEIKKCLEIHDPWAKFDFSKKRYSSLTGANNLHSIDDITPYMNKSSKSKKGYRLIYLKDKS
ncbi:MAG: hypothetical protein IPL26_12725 [Leptospiraceae bacterium]|nr:hypothetical protein [Leptospiraceae bacterium]